MYTRCPQCRTVYRINAVQLRCGRGEAICNRCNLIFGALENLADRLEEALADHTTCLLELPQLDGGVAVAIAPNLPPPAPIPKMEQDEVAAGPEPSRSTDYFESRPADLSGAKISNRYWILAAMLLALLLLIQIFVLARERMAQSLHLRPLVAWLCQRLGCELSPFRNLTAIKVVDRALYPVKNSTDGYEFHLVIVNQAPYPQPYPFLKLTLTAMDGTGIAQRIFKPEEYLRTLIPQLMPSHRSIFIDLALAAPKREVGGFQFEFLE